MLSLANLRKALDVAVSIVVLIAGILLIRAFSTDTAPAPPLSIPLYAAGDTFEPAEGLALDPILPTLIMHLQSTCRFCTASMDFYKRLAAAAPRARLVVVGYEPASVLEAYAKAHGFEPNQVVSVPPRSLKTRGTPTLMLAGPDAVLIDVWRGQLNEEQEALVLDAVVR